MPGRDLVRVFVRVFEVVLGYNGRLSRINPYATVHPGPFLEQAAKKRLDL